MSNQQKPTLKNLFNDLRDLTFDCFKIYRDPYNLFHVRYNRDMPLDSDDALKVSIAQIEGIEKHGLTPEKIKEAVVKIEENQKTRDELQKRLDDIRLRWDNLTQGKFPEPFDFGGGYRPEITDIVSFFRLIMIVEAKCKKNNLFIPYHVFRDALAEELRKQTEEYLQKWGKEIEKLSQTEKDEKPAEPGKGDIRAETVNIVNVIGSAKIDKIQQAGTKAKQEATTGKDRYEELREVLQLLKESVDKLGLEFQRKTELQEQIKEIDREMSFSKPNDKFITKCLGFIERILLEVPSHMIAIQLVEGIKYLKTLF